MFFEPISINIHYLRTKPTPLHSSRWDLSNHTSRVILVLFLRFVEIEMCRERRHKWRFSGLLSPRTCRRIYIPLYPRVALAEIYQMAPRYRFEECWFNSQESKTNIFVINQCFLYFDSYKRTIALHIYSEAPSDRSQWRLRGGLRGYVDSILRSDDQACRKTNICVYLPVHFDFHELYTHSSNR